MCESAIHRVSSLPLTLNYSLWPADESVASFLKSENRVFSHHEMGMNWYYLKHTCVHPSERTIYVFDATDKDREFMGFLQSVFSASFHMVASSLEYLSTLHFTASRNSSVWLFAPQSDFSTLLPQLGLLHSAILQPELFPPVWKRVADDV